MLILQYREGFEDVKIIQIHNHDDIEYATDANRFVFIIEKPESLLDHAFFKPSEQHPGTLGTDGLTRIWNALCSEHTSKFENRKDGALQLGRYILDSYAALPYWDAANEEEGMSEDREQLKAEITRLQRQLAESRRPLVVAVGKPMRAGTQNAKIFAEAYDADRTWEEIAAASGVEVNKVKSLVKTGFRIHYGITYTVDQEGRVTLSLPDGFTADTIVKDVKAVGGGNGDGRRSKGREMYEAARQGIFPERLTVESEGNMHRQKGLFDPIAELAEKGDWDGLADFPIYGTDVYSAQAARYKDCLLVAHRAQMKQEQSQDEAA